MTNSLMLATCMMNIGTLFSVSAMASAATASFIGASAFSLISLINFAKVRSALALHWPISSPDGCASASSALCNRCSLAENCVSSWLTPAYTLGCPLSKRGAFFLQVKNLERREAQLIGA